MDRFSSHLEQQNTGYYYKPQSYQLINQLRDNEDQQLVLSGVGQCQLESEVDCAAVYHDERNVVYQRDRLAPVTSLETSNSLYSQVQQIDDHQVAQNVNEGITYGDQVYCLPSANMNYIQQVNSMQTFSNQFAQPSPLLEHQLYEQNLEYSPTTPMQQQQQQQQQSQPQQQPQQPQRQQQQQLHSQQHNFRQQQQLHTVPSSDLGSSISQCQAQPIVTSDDRYNFSSPVQGQSQAYYQNLADVYPSSVKHRQQLLLQQQQQQQLSIHLNQRQALMEEQNSMTPLISDLQPRQSCDNVVNQCVEMITAQTQPANQSDLIPTTGSIMNLNNQIPVESNLDSSVLFDHEQSLLNAKYDTDRIDSSQGGNLVDSLALRQPRQQQQPQPQRPQQQQQQQQHERHQQQDFVELKSSYGSVSQDWLDTICRHVIEHMNRYGICVIDNFLGPVKGDLILKEVHQLYAGGQYTRGRLVSNKLSSRASNEGTDTIRNDRVIWIDGCEEGCSEINNLIQTLCSVIMNSSRLSLYSNNGLDKVVINKRTRAHVACYPGDGTRYIKHVDNPNDDGRVITSIYYLNKDWFSKRDGGLLRMFPVDIDEVANIEPLFDRVLFFWSDRRNPHEVLPAYRDRFAITVWYIGENRSA